jgi:lipopolysaccharide biosynthesis protein
MIHVEPHILKAFSQMKNLLIFSSYSADNSLPPYVLHLLKNIQDNCEITKTIFVWTGTELSHLTHEALRASNTEIIIRENIGFDFASYKHALAHENPQESDYDGIFFANDSVYGPFNNLKMAVAGYELFDIWGMTDSWQHNYHLQTYFFYIRNTAFQEIRSFFHQYKTYTRHSDIVTYGEMKLSEWFLNHGKKLGCKFTAEKIIARHLSDKPILRLITTLKSISLPFKKSKRAFLDFSPTKRLWKICLQEGSPFIKRKLLVEKKNYKHHKEEWMQVIHSEYEVATQLAYESVTIERARKAE